MNRTIILFLFLLFPFIASCNANSVHPKHHALYQVKWYAGYTMPQFLDKLVHPKTIADIKSLLNKKWDDSFKVRQHKNSPIITLTSCRDYINTKQRPLWTVHEWDNRAFMNYATMCLATQAISQATPSRISTFNTLKFDKNLPMRLPAKMAMFTSTYEQKRILARKSIKHMSQVYKITKIKQHSRYDTSYFEDGQEQELRLVAKGDFNHDGVEDYLISSQESVQGGTYSALRLYLITRHPGLADYTLLKEYKY